MSNNNLQQLLQQIQQVETSEDEDEITEQQASETIKQICINHVREQDG